MAEQAALRIIVTGLVQGVMFRDFTLRRAEELSLTGYVRNLPGRGVEVKAEGERARLEELLATVKLGSPKSVVENVSPAWSEFTGQYRDFIIIF
jgi:acylphosphatase